MPPRGQPDVLRISHLELDGCDLAVLSTPTAAEERRLARLSRAEHEIAAMMARGMTNAEIAAARGRSIRTVANQVASLYRRLGVNSRAGLAAALAERDADDAGGDDGEG